MPDSSWMMICVFLAIRALFTVGKPRASSKELVWSDCVPPNTAAMASITVRITLLYGSCITIKMTKRKLHWVYVKIWNFFFLTYVGLNVPALSETSQMSGSVCAGEGTLHFWAGSFLGWAWPKASWLPSALQFPCRNSSRFPRRKKAWIGEKCFIFILFFYRWEHCGLFSLCPSRRILVCACCGDYLTIS